MRFSVGAVNVRSGNFVYFDTTTRTIQAEHIMASGALPPGFPAVEVDGELYWDGGLISNTPLQWVTTGGETAERHDTLAFQVDLWSSRGEAPTDLADVIMRQKEIQYSSRTRYNTDNFKRLQTVRRTLAEALDKVPPEWLDNDDGRLLRSFADRKVYSVVHLIYRSKNYEKAIQGLRVLRGQHARSLAGRLQRHGALAAPSGSAAAPDRPHRCCNLRPRRRGA